MDKNDPCFSVKQQFKLYTQRVKLDEAKVSTRQWIETRRAFYGGVAQFLLMLRDELAELSEDDGVETLEKMLQEVNNFWIQESNRQN